MKKFKVEFSYEMEVEAESRGEAKDKLSDYLINVDVCDNMTVQEIE